MWVLNVLAAIPIIPSWVGGPELYLKNYGEFAAHLSTTIFLTVLVVFAYLECYHEAKSHLVTKDNPKNISKQSHIKLRECDRRYTFWYIAIGFSVGLEVAWYIANLIRYNIHPVYDINDMQLV